MVATRHLVLSCALALLPFTAAECKGPPPTDEQAIGTLRPGVLKGYLAPTSLPNSRSLLPAAPATGSASGKADQASAIAALHAQGGAAWAQAAKDADLSKDAALSAFSMALGFEPSSKATPHLAVLLRRVMADAGMATVAAKDAYARTRPFVELKAQTCTPAEDASLAKSGSYPSGHASIGWAWALVLAELLPEKADAVLKRGLAIGDSRVTCLAHWQSDVEAGRLVGAAVVAALHRDPVFTAQLQLARSEAIRAHENCTRPGQPARKSPYCVSP